VRGTDLLEPTLDSIITNGLLDDIELLALDRGYDYPVVCQRLASYGQLRPGRTRDPETRNQATTGHTAPTHTRAAMDCRSPQLVVLKLRSLCGAVDYAAWRVDGCVELVLCRYRSGFGRHNQRLSRKASTASGGVKRPGGTSGGVVRARACSLSARSAWR